MPASQATLMPIKWQLGVTVILLLWLRLALNYLILLPPYPMWCHTLPCLSNMCVVRSCIKFSLMRWIVLILLFIFFFPFISCSAEGWIPPLTKRIPYHTAEPLFTCWIFIFEISGIGVYSNLQIISLPLYSISFLEFTKGFQGSIQSLLVVS